MTRIDFYILNATDEQQRTLLACKLAEKAYQQDYRIFIHTASPEMTADLDERLWTFRAGSFLPHARAGDKAEPAPPILLDHAAEPETHVDLLINLASEVPEFFSRFERLAEVIDQQPDNLNRGRERYKFYQERGYQLQTHKLNR